MKEFDLDTVIGEIRVHGLGAVMHLILKDPNFADQVAQRCAEFAQADSLLQTRESWCIFATQIARAAAAKRIMDSYAERGFEYEANQVAELAEIKKYL